jgi:hypothetical protein
MSTGCVTRALQAIRRHDLPAHQIDDAILAAINVGLCLATGGNDVAAEGFNLDIARNGHGFRSVERCTA